MSFFDSDDTFCETLKNGFKTNFKRCSSLQDNGCFNYSRCQAKSLKYMYVYDESCEKIWIWNICNKSKSQAFLLQELVRNSSQFAMTSAYDEACISVSVISKQCFQNLDKNNNWDNGSNHVFVINSQFPNDLPFGGYIPRTSYKAIFAQTFQMKCWDRQGYKWYFCTTVSKVSCE